MDSINKIKNKIFFPCLLIILLFFGFTNFVFAQNNNIIGWDRPLETDYLEIEGVRPETVGFGVVEYFTYVFNFIIILSGMFALIGLIKGGINYVTSSGDPGKIKKARDQIIATFVGIIILLGSYIMLYNISPQLVILDLITPERVAYEPEYGPGSETTEDTPFGRIAEIAANLIRASERIKSLTEVLDELIANCSCSNVWSSCICVSYPECTPQGCWIGEDSHPCPEWRSIELIQRQLLALRDTIEYYKERLEGELKDLSFETEQIAEEITYYEDRIIVESDILDALDEENQVAIINQERLINRLENKLTILILEFEILLMAQEQTEALIELIPQLTDEITRLAEFDETLGYSLIDSCWQNVPDACDPECSGECHNDICIPERCSGEPCEPLNTGTIRSLANRIIDHSTAILDLWDIDVPQDEYSVPDFGWPDLPVLPPAEGSNMPWGCPTRIGGIVTSAYGTRGGAHRGIDIQRHPRQNNIHGIYATAEGRVALVRIQGGITGGGVGYGLYVIVDHQNGYYTLYAHLASVNVSENQLVSRGDLIGRMGGIRSGQISSSPETARAGSSTGLHVHYEVKYGYFGTRLDVNQPRWGICDGVCSAQNNNTLPWTALPEQ